VGTIRGTGPGERFDGKGTCYIEFGRGLVAKVEADFLGGPRPQGVLVGPSRELAQEKADFARVRRKRWFGVD
jgi:sulfide:quinone oxidoreductase